MLITTYMILSFCMFSLALNRCVLFNSDEIKKIVTHENIKIFSCFNIKICLTTTKTRGIIIVY